jgi:hypothetical protein
MTTNDKAWPPIPFDAIAAARPAAQAGQAARAAAPDPGPRRAVSSRFQPVPFGMK